jgi:hypothetical protein
VGAVRECETDAETEKAADERQILHVPERPHLGVEPADQQQLHEQTKAGEHGNVDEAGAVREGGNPSPLAIAFPLQEGLDHVQHWILAGRVSFRKDDGATEGVPGEVARIPLPPDVRKAALRRQLEDLTTKEKRQREPVGGYRTPAPGPHI